MKEQHDVTTRAFAGRAGGRQAPGSSLPPEPSLRWQRPRGRDGGRRSNASRCSADPPRARSPGKQRRAGYAGHPCDAGARRGALTVVPRARRFHAHGRWPPRVRRWLVPSTGIVGCHGSESRRGRGRFSARLGLSPGRRSVAAQPDLLGRGQERLVEGAAAQRPRPRRPRAARGTVRAARRVSLHR
jgi:hypothetical protein